MTKITQLEISWFLDESYVEDFGWRWPNADRENSRKETLSTNIDLVWADKVGLVTALVIAILCVLICVAVLIAAETVTYSKLNHVLMAWSGLVELTIALPIWVLMRGIDFVTNGPKRRRADRKPRIEYCEIVPVTPADGSDLMLYGK